MFALIHRISDDVRQNLQRNFEISMDFRAVTVYNGASINHP